jgi:protein phosphatase
LLPRLIQQANVAIHDCTLEQEHQDRMMATTVVACALRYDRAIVSHVGDSRCYLVRRGSARQITDDHTWVNQQRKLGILSASEMAESEARHILIRSLGPEMFVAPDTTILDLYPGDVLVLCSDGMHDEMSEEAIAAIASQDKIPGEIARELVAKAVEIDGHDNATAQVIRVLSVERMSSMPRGRPYK